MHKAPDKLKERDVSGGNKYAESTCAVAMYAPPRTAPNVNLTSGLEDTEVLDIIVSDRIHGTWSGCVRRLGRGSHATYKSQSREQLSTRGKP